MEQVKHSREKEPGRDVLTLAVPGPCALFFILNICAARLLAERRSMVTKHLTKAKFGMEFFKFCLCLSIPGVAVFVFRVCIVCTRACSNSVCW